MHRTLDGVMKELCMYLLIYNLVRLMMLRWAARNGVDVRRVSFIDAYRALAAWALGLDGIDQLVLIPDRSGRANP